MRIEHQPTAPSFFLFLLFLGFIFSCAPPIKMIIPTPPIKEIIPQPFPFEEVVRPFGLNLLRQIKNYHSNSEQPHRPINIVIDPFFDAHSLGDLQIFKRIEAALQQARIKHFPDMTLGLINSTELGHAKYIIQGQLRFEPIIYDNYSEKFYHILSTVIDKQKIIAKADVWLSDLNLDYKGSGIHPDAPMFITDANREKTRMIIESPIGAKVDSENIDFLETKAILVSAGNAYETKDYQKALQLFQQAAQRSDGRIMETYAGLYLTYYVLDNRKKAEDAFAQLVDISVKKNRALSVKFLFEVNRAAFLNNANLRKQYKIWLKIIGEYFSKSPDCLLIVGHCSKTGPEKWNDKLSGMRAQRIQQLMRPSFPKIKQRSQPIGKGSNENIVGAGTDDERDALDRRVEFKLTDCSAIK